MDIKVENIVLKCTGGGCMVEVGTHVRSGWTIGLTDEGCLCIYLPGDWHNGAEQVAALYVTGERIMKTQSGHTTAEGIYGLAVLEDILEDIMEWRDHCDSGKMNSLRLTYNTPGV